MKKLAVLICGIALFTLAATPGFAFQEYPSLEIAPYVGYIVYDGDMTEYMSNLAYGFRVDLRTMAALGFQFHYARSTREDDLPSFPFGTDDYVERIQLNFTRDTLLSKGIFFSSYLGVGSFNRHGVDVYYNDPTLQAGVAFRRNLVGPLYLRGDLGWTGAFLDELTHHLDAALTFSLLLDN